MSAPTVSIIIALHNGRSFIEETLDSVFVQTWKEIEVVVVDDGSTDGSADLVQSLRPTVKLIPLDGKGVSIARNVGFTASTGDFVVFLDQDDLLAPDYAERLVAAFEADPSLEVCSCDCVMFRDIDGVRDPFATHRYREVAGTAKEVLMHVVMQSPGLVLLRRAAFVSLGGFDPCYSSAGEDYNFFLKAAELLKWEMVPFEGFLYRIHDSANSGNYTRMYGRSVLIPKLHRISFGPASFPKSKLKPFRWGVTKFFARQMLRNLAGKGRKESRGNAVRKAFGFSLKHPLMIPALFAVVFEQVRYRFGKN